MTSEDIQNYIDEEGFYSFERSDSVTINGESCKVKLIEEKLDSYDEGVTTTAYIFQVNEHLFRVYKEYNSWEGSEYSVEKVVISGYKQVPIYEAIEE